MSTYNVQLIYIYQSFISIATVVVPLSVHVALLGVFMFLNGIATGSLENGTYTCTYTAIYMYLWCSMQVVLLHDAVHGITCTRTRTCKASMLRRVPVL